MQSHKGEVPPKVDPIPIKVGLNKNASTQLF